MSLSPPHIQIGQALRPQLDHLNPYTLTYEQLYVSDIFIPILFVARTGIFAIGILIGTERINTNPNQNLDNQYLTWSQYGLYT